MAREFTGLAAAALVFGITYTCLLIWLLQKFATKQFSFKSKWTLLLIHVLIRVASQALGVAFGILVFDNVGVFIAYLVLGMLLHQVQLDLLR